MSGQGSTVVGVPIDSVGLGRAEAHGTGLSPAAVRAAGRDRLGWADVGDLDVRIPDHERDKASGLIGIDGVLSTTSSVRAATADLVRRGERPFLLGGCCTLLVGALAGARDALGSVSLVYADGHLDLYDGITSPTGEAADMPISVVRGHGPLSWVERVAPSPVVPPPGIALLGYHDPDELADVGEALARSRAAGLPATDYLQPGGLDWNELVDLVAPVAAADGLVGWSIACYNPEKDPAGTDGRAIVAAIERLLPA